MLSFSYLIFLFLLIFSPLAFGARDPWALSVIEWGCALGALLYLGVTKGKKKLYRVPGLLPLGLFAGWLLFQAVPLPVALVKWLSPATHAIYRESLGPLYEVRWIPLSVDPGKTLAESFRFSAYLLFYWWAVQLLADRTKLKKTVLVVAGLAGCMAVYAIVETLFTNGKIYGFYAGPANNTHVGPYVYHNHYSGFMGMVLPMVLGLYLYYRPQVRYGSWRERVVEFWNGAAGHLHLLLGFTAVLMGTSVFLSLSRGGIISLCLSMICLIGFFSLRKGGSRRKRFVSLAVLLMFLSVSWFGWEPVVERFGRAFNEEGELVNTRFSIWDDTHGMVNDFFLAGTGLGSFGAIYPSYRSLGGHKFVSHAHNDYVELLACGGVIGSLLVACFVVALFRATWIMYRSRRDPYAHCLYLGAFAGLLAIFFHSVVDFNFYNNANGLFFFFMCSLAVAASHTRIRGRQETFLTESPLVQKRAVWFTAVIFLGLVSVYQGGLLRASSLFNRVEGTVIEEDTSDEEVEGVIVALGRATLLAPMESLYPFALARTFAFYGQDKAFEEQLKRALWLCPVTSSVLQYTARYLCRKNQVALGRHYFEMAIAHDTANPERRKMFAGWLLGRGETEEAVAHMKQAMLLNTSRQNIKGCVSLLLYHGVSKEAVYAMLPERIYPRFVFADTMRAFGDHDLAREVTVRALDYLDTEDSLRPWFFTRVYWVYMKEKDYDMALSVLQKASQYFPDHAKIRLLIGDTYVKMGIPYRAVEEYERVLIVDPDNRRATAGLKRLSSYL
ncbi:O-antigen ligase family protein [Desulfoluna butyratoxydans]|uniref:O-antigen ligase-related n=1 Tax=Desulfoluna butyratoxydans TaxID=231438 RepID=A0A4U8YYF8_9BACT|nr:O-antigen ligase family protein [Desulfoluna butyratoxydans]VFQ46563.1 o-antigen ligase-related [Desulfoluna butyratoxydans]